MAETIKEVSGPTRMTVPGEESCLTCTHFCQAHYPGTLEDPSEDIIYCNLTEEQEPMSALVGDGDNTLEEVAQSCKHYDRIMAKCNICGKYLGPANAIDLVTVLDFFSGEPYFVCPEHKDKALAIEENNKKMYSESVRKQWEI